MGERHHGARPVVTRPPRRRVTLRRAGAGARDPPPGVAVRGHRRGLLGPGSAARVAAGRRQEREPRPGGIWRGLSRPGSNEEEQEEEGAAAAQPGGCSHPASLFRRSHGTLSPPAPPRRACDGFVLVERGPGKADMWWDLLRADEQPPPPPPPSGRACIASRAASRARRTRVRRAQPSARLLARPGSPR